RPMLLQSAASGAHISKPEITAAGSKDVSQATELGLPREVYEQLRAIAHARMTKERAGHTLQSTALVHEALIRLAGAAAIAGADRPAFVRAAAETMRRILIDHARARAAEKRGGGAGNHRVELDGVALPSADGKIVELLALDEAIVRLERQSPDAAAVVRLRFY